MTLNNDALMNEAMKTLFNAIAAREGITVRYDKRIEAPSATKGGLITLRPPSAIKPDQYWYEALHELGHKLREMDWTYGEELASMVNMEDPPSRALANVLVDSLEERNFMGQFDGVDRMLDKGRAAWTQGAINSAPRIHDADPLTALIGTVQMVDANWRQDWMGTLMESLPVSEALLGMHVPIQDSLERMGFKERMELLSDPDEPNHAKLLAELIKDILEIIGYEPPPPEGGKGEGPGEGESGDGESCSACEGSGKDEDGEECKECDGTGKEDCHSDTSGDSGEYDISRGSDKETSGEGRGHSAGKDYDMSDQDVDPEAIIKAIDEKLLEEIGEKEYKKDTVPSAWSGSRSVEDYVPWPEHRIVEIEEKLNDYRPGMKKAITEALGNSTVSKQISKYLKALVSESYTYGQRKGKLHHKNMHRLFTQRPMPGVQPAIYKQRNSTVVKLDSAVTIQLDCSGSMGGPKYVTGGACVAALSDTLTSLRIPHEILGFSEHRCLTTYIFKRFGTTMNKDKVIQSLSNSQVSLCENADGESVLWAAERLAMRPEKNKLQIVLSDGRPAGCYSGNGDAYLKHVCKLIEGTKIDLVGVGIMTSSVSRYYTNHTVVNRPEELDRALFGILKNFLI